MKRALILLPLVAAVAAACGGDGDPVTIENAWARTSPAATKLGAVYLDVTVDADDVLLRADVPESVADDAEVHEVVMVEMDGETGETTDRDEMDETAGSDDMDEGAEDAMGAMRMQELTEGLALRADETVSLEPGGYHIMLIDLVEPLDVGDEIDLTLEFAEAGTTSVTVEVRESAP